MDLTKETSLQVQEMLDIVKTFPRMGGAASTKLAAATSADDAAEEELSKEQKGGNLGLHLVYYIVFPAIFQTNIS